MGKESEAGFQVEKGYARRVLVGCQRFKVVSKKYHCKGVFWHVLASC
jgi:hypothetical protein